MIACNQAEHIAVHLVDALASTQRSADAPANCSGRIDWTPLLLVICDVQLPFQGLTD